MDKVIRPSQKDPFYKHLLANLSATKLKVRRTKGGRSLGRIGAKTLSVSPLKPGKRSLVVCRTKDNRVGGLVKEAVNVSRVKALLRVREMVPIFDLTDAFKATKMHSHHWPSGQVRSVERVHFLQDSGLNANIPPDQLGKDLTPVLPNKTCARIPRGPVVDDSDIVRHGDAVLFG